MDTNSWVDIIIDHLNNRGDVLAKKLLYFMNTYCFTRLEEIEIVVDENNNIIDVYVDRHRASDHIS